MSGCFEPSTLRKLGRARSALLPFARRAPRAMTDSRALGSPANPNDAPGEPLPKLRFLARYIAFWFLFFALLRLAFLAYHESESLELSASLVAGLLARGARMDISAASYLALIPARALALVLRAYTILAIVIASLLAATDFELFAKWGSRVDATLLPYLRTPREACLLYTSDAADE